MFDVTKLLNFGVGESSTSENNICFSSSKGLLRKYEWLVFVDSRGLERECSVEETWLYKLCKSLDLRGISYLAVSRPKNITVFATLVNFLNLNNIHFNKLLTNLGFVDCTPKKHIFIKDINEQTKEFFNEDLEVHIFPQYLDSEEEMINLYNLQYSDDYLMEVVKHLNLSFIESYFITTPIIDSSLMFKRKRPDCFYKQLKVTNEFIHKINLLSNGKILKMEPLSLCTFDGVHFTESDHTKLSDDVIKWIL
ncbi:hypothetical protein [Colwellia hornerae]|uniref:SGNH/GDSL hydrolase family protein n=1 Tax=Colwellia hornerae TaxID=89402 RepID=A0A5C6QKK7_9GAMM|nr:hypothetical protein [Colwellia hornerae]TWX54055.1 hypothetical protein ESZ28_08355 [Colwellia hornerae]TWX60830.1 hypothetical protein ESZ26_07130 [Colwellia hornerae]TWX69160.1 hypothetical protein ESZ27_05890 [Colwellia hornerae]